MHKIDIRAGVSIAYEDDSFGRPWTLPETVVMVHGNSESSRAWIPHIAAVDPELCAGHARRFMAEVSARKTQRLPNTSC